jgi:uncharacterized protein YecT (DUF1311 family)
MLRRNAILVTAAVMVLSACDAGAATEAIAEQYDEANDTLNYEYGSILGNLTPPGRDKLRQAERRWIAERNRACGFESRTACSLSWIRKRQAELERMMGSMSTNPDRVRAGQCFLSKVSEVSTRLGAPDGHGNLLPVPDSGTAVTFADGTYMVDYYVVHSVDRWRRADPVRLCVMKLPTHCPKGDLRGITWRAMNLRTRYSWTAADSEHMCGGA